MYPEYKSLDLSAIDRDILQLWEDKDIFRKSIEQRSPENTYVFYEGPPSANGMPGIHHVMARTIKDLFCRFHTMNGKRVERKGGWDTHGLPVELAVEKELGITKEDIGKKISIADYNAKCREAVMKFKDKWDDITLKMGYWVDLDNPYVTFDKEYIETIWYLLKKLYDKGLLYKGYTVQPFSPAAGTGLSSHELNMPGTYRDVKDTSVVAQFKILQDEASAPLFDSREDDQELFFLAWTTTPWTLPSNTALSVGPKVRYVLVRTLNPYTQLPCYVILAKDTLPMWFQPDQEVHDISMLDPDAKKIGYKIISEFSGASFSGIRYEQLMPYGVPVDGDSFVVVCGDHVTTEDGTGIVHTAPSFGADDMMMAKKHGLGSLTLVDKQGRFVDEVTDFAGRYVKNYTDDQDFENPDVDIAIKLKTDNRAFNVQKYSHNYPHCWRTDKPILYYPLDSWFVKTTACKDRMVELNNTINWKPSHTGEKRFGNWLENLQDWNLSRSRYWGTPLPIWRSEGGDELCIGSLEELADAIGQANKVLGLDQEVPQDLHRPYIDDVVLVSPSGKPMHRELDLIDVWFDSGSMPYAQWHYPFENKDIFERNYPADFIAEGVDQTRGWFFTLHAIATMAFDSVAFKNVVSNGLVQDKEGRKMSKRLGNAVDPFDTLAQYGADATRWYMIANAQPWDNLKFDISGVEEVRRKFFGTLFNTYSFFALYANIDKFDYREKDIPYDHRPELDRWILSMLHSLISEVRQDYADYEPTNAARKMQDFVDRNLSNWFVRLSRRRYWKGEYSEDKISAYQTLYRCLTVLSKLMAPISPFFADWLYSNLNNTTSLESVESVHLADWPIADKAAIDKDLETKMDYAQRITSLVLSLRKKHNVRVRQPLQKMIIPVSNELFADKIRAVEPIILAEVNVKEIEYMTDTSSVIKKKVKPNFKTLGKKLGKHMKEAASQIAQMTQDGISQIEKQGSYTISVGGDQIQLTLEDLVITTEDIPGWLVATDNEITVALDVQFTDHLLAEGTARELVNRIQNLRKDEDFNVTDRIQVKISNNALVQDALNSFEDYISREVLADSIAVAQDVQGTEVDFLNEEKIVIQLHKS